MTKEKKNLTKSYKFHKSLAYKQYTKSSEPPDKNSPLHPANKIVSKPLKQLQNLK